MYCSLLSLFGKVFWGYLRILKGDVQVPASDKQNVHLSFEKIQVVGKRGYCHF